MAKVFSIEDTDSDVRGSAVMADGKYELRIFNAGVPVFNLTGGTFASDKDAAQAAVKAFYKFLGWFWTQECPSPAGCRNRYPYPRHESIRVSDGFIRVITGDGVEWIVGRSY